MQIPDGPSGNPTVSVSSLRKYGAGGLALDEQEDDKGCPRWWKAHYVDQDPAVRDVTSAPLEYGTYWHAVMSRIDSEDVTPDEAVLLEFQPHYPQAFLVEIKRDLENYLSRSAAPSDRYGLLAAEVELDAVLYVDEEFGPVHMRGFLDWIGVDLDTSGVVHIVDYKTNRTPPSEASVRGDVQLKGYHWLVEQHAARFGNPARIVSHLDAIKWRDVEVAYTAREIEDWHDWAVAVTRTILRDEKAEPRLNDGCGFCPIRSTCSEFQALPQGAAVLLASVPGDDAEDEVLLTWRDNANRTRLLLEKAVKAIDGTFKQRALTQGGLVVGDEQYVVETQYGNVVDVRTLHEVIGDDLYLLASVGKGALETYASGLDASKQADVLSTLRREPTGVTTKRRPLT